MSGTDGFVKGSSMFTPHSPRTTRRIICVLACACLFSAGAHTRLYAQKYVQTYSADDTALGVELYNQRKFKEAIDILKKVCKQNLTNVTAWQFLGLAYKQKGDRKNARQALEKAVYLRCLRFAPNSFTVANKKAAELNEEESEVLRAERTRRYREALEVVEAYLQVQPKDAALWREQAENLRFYIAEAENQTNPPAFYTSKEVTKRPRITNNPEPEYNEEARKYSVRGEVILRVVLAADGSVQHILVCKPLPHGMTEQAIKAARQIQFTPAIKDGRPVAQASIILYTFNIY